MDAKLLNEAIKYAIATGFKCGYQIDDEGRSLAGYSAFIALRYWEESRGRSFKSYVTEIFLRSLSRLRRWRTLDPNAFIFIARKNVHRDLLQQRLLEFPEPVCSICFAIWIERRSKQEVAETYSTTIHQINVWLEHVAKQLRHHYEDNVL